MSEILIFITFIILFGILPSIWYLKQKNKPNDGQLYFLHIIDILIITLVNTFIVFISTANSISSTLLIVYILPIITLLSYSYFTKSNDFRTNIKVIRFISYLILFFSIIYLFNK